MKKYLLIVPAAALVSLQSLAAGIGSLQDVRLDDSQFSVDAGYYYQRSDWEGINNALANNAMEDVVREAPYVRVNYQFIPNWFVSGIYGYEGIYNDPDVDSLKLESDVRDTFYGMQLQGRFYESEKLDIGAFIQYASYADYRFAGNVLTSNFNVKVSDLKDVLAGITLQRSYNTMDIYGGAFYQDNSAEIKGVVNSLSLDKTIEVDSNVGAMVGANFHVSNNLDINLEYQNRGNHGIDIGVTYHFKRPAPEVITRTVTQIIEVPVSAPVIGPDSYDGTINFAEGSNQINKSQISTIRQLARFLEHNPEASAVVEGHCDCTGPEAANQDLSEQRAASVKSFIIDYYGIAEERIVTEGYGELMPVDTNDTAEGRQNNRRVRIYAKKP